MKKLKNLQGAKELSKVEQRAIKGGRFNCTELEPGVFIPCPDGYYCNRINGVCYPIIDMI